MTPAGLVELIRGTAVEVLTARGLDAAALPATITVQQPRGPEHGDHATHAAYATNIALQSALRLGVEPRELAGWLVAALAERDGVHSAEVAGPGFINLRLASGATGPIVREVLTGAGGGADPDRAASQVTLAVDELAGAAGPAWAALVPAVGTDAARYALVRTGAPVGGDDTEAWSRWLRRTDENPLFTVQYAHARLAAAERNAAELGVRLDPGHAELGLLREELEGELASVLGDYRRVLRLAADRAEPRRLARYLERLADLSTEFVTLGRVLPAGDQPPEPVHTARLALCAAARQVLAGGLRLLGVTAPERT